MDAPATVHGLDYPAHFVDSLPVLRPRPDPHPPIRALTTSQFSDLHFAHLTSHAPDHVLFPFLHGLEGENEQQNAFFASARPKGDVPRFRGLVWVACDEDEDDVCDVDDFDEEDDDDYSSNSSLDSFGPTDLDEDVPMELDPTVEGPVVNGCPPPKPLDKVPVSPPPVPITAGQLPSNSNASTHTKPSFLTSSFRPRELLRTRTDERGSANVFVDPKIPDGISLRNFGIQVPIYATISDIVVYSPRGITRSATAVAEKFKQAVELKYEERRSRAPNPDALVLYNVFVLDASASEMATTLPHLVARTEDIAFSGAHTDGTDAHTNGESDDTSRLLRANTIDFAQREKDEMRDLTQASEIVSIVDPNSGIDLAALAGSNTATHWEPLAGQIFLGNSNDVPLPPDRRIRMRTLRGDEENDEDTFDWRTNDPGQGYGYDVCIECHDYAPFPTSAHLRAAEEHLRVLEKRWVERCVAEMGHANSTDPLPPRPPPSASHVVHLPFPSSPASSVVTVNTLLPFIAFLETLLQPFAGGPLTFGTASEQLSPSRAQNPYEVHSRRNTSAGFTPSSLPPPSSFPTSFFPSSPSSTSAYTRVRSTSATYLPASSPSTPVSTSPISSNPVPLRTRPVKILIYSADGYTESSVLALCILMAIRGISLPEAYLTLQVEKRRSFFVYQSDLGVLRRVEARLEKDRTAKNQDQSSAAGTTSSSSSQPHPLSQGEGHGDPEVPSPQGWVRSLGRASAKSVSFAAPPALDKSADPATGVSAPAAVHPMRTRSESEADAGTQSPTPGRPRAHTMPPTRVPPWKDHQAWFNDPRFDGSFPSRVLPFLYLGNLNHASNAFMLHALGITHVVSVGECALVPPPHIDSASAGAISCSLPNPGAHFVQGKGPGGQGSLWIEEREGRIKVLDIKGVCDDGIDTLEPQLQPVCDWIDKAREEGGKVLVHCRVGVSRSATVTIAYVMKHLSLPLVDAYLIVRSRRLSVLIQPNMRLLYNLLGWEAKLAWERAEAALPEEKLAGLSDEEKQAKRRTRLQGELARALNWPYLAKEVHALNEKYLH